MEPAETEVKSGVGKWIARGLAAIVVVGLLIAGYRFWQYSWTYEETDEAQIDGHMNVVGTRIPGTVLKVNVGENQAVTPGQVLIELDPADYQVTLNKQKAALNQAQVRAEAPVVSITNTNTETSVMTGKESVASAEVALAGVKRDVEAGQARVAQAEAQYSRAQAELARYEALVKKDQVSKIEYV